MGEFTWKRVLVSVLEIYACVLVYAWFFTDRQIFPRPPASYEDAAGIIKLKTRDGARISALYLPNTSAEFVILHSHGNAEDLGDVRPELEEFRDAGYAVFSYDYHGYGTSEGRPTEKNAYADVEAAYDYMVDRLGIPPNRIIARGRSLGAALALHVAVRRGVAGVVLESPFVSAFRVRTVVPLVPFDRFRNIAAVRKLRCPILVVHGEKDEAIPPWHGKAVFKAAPEPKLALWVKDGAHDDLVLAAGKAYWDSLDQLKAIIRERRAAALFSSP